jgi:hypothetical protein
MLRNSQSTNDHKTGVFKVINDIRKVLELIGFFSP